MLDGRGMYIWKLAPVINTEGGVQAVIDKAKRAQLSSVWVKIANGTSRYSNVQGQTGNRFRELIELMGEEGTTSGAGMFHACSSITMHMKRQILRPQLRMNSSSRAS